MVTVWGVGDLVFVGGSRLAPSKGSYCVAKLARHCRFGEVFVDSSF